MGLHFRENSENAFFCSFRFSPVHLSKVRAHKGSIKITLLIKITLHDVQMTPPESKGVNRFLLSFYSS